jgi:endonuclease YncB( thermonuclease family)
MSADGQGAVNSRYLAGSALLTLALTGCSSLPPIDSATPTPVVTGSVTYVVDGDTLDARLAAGSEERVRLAGIDTPERGECGYSEARTRLAELVDGRQVLLVQSGSDDRDRYDRLIRYVDVGSTDAGRVLLAEGLAVARYDSRDGYGAHPREADYIAVDAASEQGCDHS